ncbi:hypothetical protein [Catelliglobosispora koreensis]|uniref:hypothetical protein n=1 Tax=Catelliglobosispora koreensis TaxID=129052 RepID=UPI00036CD4D9|nr:hypothetical protein [Catelliglobosispora koreensis]
MEHDRQVPRPPELTAVDRPSPSFPAVLLFLPLSLLGGFFPAFSLSANLYVLVLGATLLIAGLSSRLPRRQGASELPPGVVWWLLPVGLLIVVEAITYALGSTHDYPTLSLLADPLLDDYLMRSLGYFGWLTVFWGLVRR